MLFTAASLTSCSNQDNIIYDGPVEDPIFDFDEGSLIKNGNCEGSNVANFQVQVGADGQLTAPTLKWDKITPKNHCVVIEVGEEETNFFITFDENEALKLNDEVSISLSVMADEDATATTKLQAAPGETLDEAGIGEIEFTNGWTDVQKDFTVGEDQVGVYTIAFSLPNDKIVYFDNMKVEVERAPQPVEVEGYDVVFFNFGKANDAQFSTKYFKNYTATPAEDGAIVVESLDPNKTYAEYYNGGSDAKLSVNWDTQFLISLPKSLAAGTKVKLAMKVKADKAAGSELQAHTAIPAPGAIEGKDGYAGTYIHYTLNCDNISFGTEWETVERSFTVPSQADGMQSICLNLEVLREINKYYFDDITVYVEHEAEPEEQEGWDNFYWSKPVYLSAYATKYFKNYTPTKSSSGAIVVESLDPEKVYDQYYNDGNEVKVANDHDVQFLIFLPKPLASGAKVKLTMDVKADKEAEADVQAHNADLPFPTAIEHQNPEGYNGTYMHWTLFGWGQGGVTFTTSWNTFEKEFTVPGEADGMQAICLNLEKFREVNKYYFKNIVVRVAK